MKLYNPCFTCDKADIEDVQCFEYGCCNPCEEAEEYFEQIGKKIDSLLKRAKALLGESEDTE